MIEFELIRRYFSRVQFGENVEVGVGDDCAVLKTNPQKKLCISTDTLVCGTHFLENDDPFLLGWKALAVNLSDLAACGASPRWALLAMSIPAANEKWQKRIAEFSKGFAECAQTFKVSLIGGDTTRGAWSMTVAILGETENPILRNTAKAGDDIWISGEIGWAGCGVDLKLNPDSPAHSLPESFKQKAFQHLHRPIPRVKLGENLRGIASAAIDLSDGLWGDLQHIARGSKLTAHLFLQNFPQSFLQVLPQDFALQKMLTGGEDYELCFSAPKTEREKIAEISESFKIPLFRIGYFSPPESTPIFLFDENGKNIAESQSFQGFQHF